MRILLIGAGGVGSAFTGIAARRGFFDACVVADYDEARASKAVDALDDDRFVAAQVDASSAEAVAALCQRARDHARDERGRPACSTCRSSTARSRPVRTTSTWR